MLAGPALVVRPASAPNSFSEHTRASDPGLVAASGPQFPPLYTGAVGRHRKAPVWFNASWGLGEEGAGVLEKAMLSAAQPPPVLKSHREGLGWAGLAPKEMDS